MHTLVDQKY